jgi:hypothetical protein
MACYYAATMPKLLSIVLLAITFLGCRNTTASQTSQPPLQSVEDKTLTVKIVAEGSKTSDTPSLEFLKVFAGLVGALAWPGVFVILLISQRAGLKRLLEVLTVLVQSSTRIKIGDVIDVEVDQSATEAEQRSAHTKEVPREEVAAAERVNRLVTDSELPDVRSRMVEFVREYEATRASMKPGPSRTRAMNAIVAKMRTLALAARPLLGEFATDGNSPGARLAATAILQLSPRLDYVSWLVARMGREQPFIFFHASLAILATVRSYGSVAGDNLRAAIQEALRTVTSFKEGPPDQNTIDILEAALSELEHSNSA